MNVKILKLDGRGHKMRAMSFCISFAILASVFGFYAAPAMSQALSNRCATQFGICLLPYGLPVGSPCGCGNAGGRIVF